MAPLPAYCEEKQRLLDAFFAACQEVFRLQNQKLEEVAKGGGMDMFDRAVQSARKQRDAAQAAWVEHIAEHGC